MLSVYGLHQMSLLGSEPDNYRREMITKSSNLVIVEGNLVPVDGDAAAIRGRVEIDASTGLIVETGEARGTGDLVLDDDHIIMAGIIDQHVHAREDPTGKENYKETFQTAGEAAVNGGVVAIVDMPNNPEAPVDDETYLKKKDLTAGGLVDILLYAGVGPGTAPLSFPVPYKVYMGPSIGHLFFKNEDALRDALSRYRGHFVAFHAEDPVILEENEGAATHFLRRPPEAEVEAIDLILRMGDNYGIRPHICHLSTAEGLELIRGARKKGLRVTTEVTPHHLYYDQDNAQGFSRPDYLQCNPPIRTRLDRIALLEGLRCGDIECLATDHAPHTIEEKDLGVSGVTQLDTFGAFLFWLMEEGFDLPTLQRACAEVPGRFLGRYLPHRYGKIEPGFVGSLTVLKKESFTVRRAELKTRAGWSPFEAVTFPGRASHTIVRGQIYPRLD